MDHRTKPAKCSVSWCALLTYLAAGACSSDAPEAFATEPAKQDYESRTLAPPVPTVADMDRRVTYVAGMSLAVPAGARVAYPQGIDSNILHITGEGFEISADDYGGYSGGGDRTLGGGPAKMTERRGSGCRERTWEVELPTTNPAMMHCPSPNAQRDQCRAEPAHATLRSLCATDAACGTVDSIIASARFTPKPWAALVTPDGHWQPPEPVCEVSAD